MKYYWTTLVVCFLLVGCGDSVQPPTTENDSSPAASDSITEAGTPPSETSSNEPPKSAALAAFEQTQKEFTDKRNAFIKELRTLPEDKQVAFIENNAPRSGEYAEKFLSIAEDHPDDPVAEEALMWIAQHRIGGEVEEKAYNILFEKYVESKKMGDLSFPLMFGMPSEKTEQRIKTLLEKSPHDEVKAKMTFALANYYQSNKAEEIGETEIISLYEALATKYGEFKMDERSKQTFAQQAKNSIFELKYLRIGKVAPEIEGEDLDGVEFKLSDYRGKVVVLDFWGDW